MGLVISEMGYGQKHANRARNHDPGGIRSIWATWKMGMNVLKLQEIGKAVGEVTGHA